MKVVLLIPIKLNNQRLPGKNLKMLNGKPLCTYIFETVKDIEEIDEKYVYCSNEDIISYMPDGLTFKERDTNLDRNETKGLEIIESFVNSVDADIYVLAHATQPFTKASSIVEGLNQIKSGEYDSAFSAIGMQDYCWYQGKPFNYDLSDIPRTQDLEPVYMETSGFFIFTKEVFKNYHQRIGKKPYMCIVDAFEAIDIDTPIDFAFAEAAAEYLSKNPE
ncbi:MAG: acylneuraminate cytidylyltransferase family protein [Dysgonomonas sp.]|nr:acylneuraminate cytidylyltransferase family protein [Dysgonomonas sp.]